jgi:outer membrane protein assembly factor BamB
VGDVESHELPPYLASLLVVDDEELAQSAMRESNLAKLLQSLRPYGGVACLRLDADQEQSLRASAMFSDSEDYEIDRAGDYVLIRRGALRGAGEWTHQNADAGNTLISRDTLVKLPLGVLWFGGPSNQKILPRHGHGPVPQVVDGRLVIEGPDILRAIDIYTGRLLWERRLPDIGLFYDNTGHHPGAGAIGGNYVTLHDAIYVAYGRVGLKLNPATGEVVDELRLPPHDDEGLIDAKEETPLDVPRRESPYWGFLAAHEELLIAGSSPLTPLSSSRHKPDSLGLEARYGESSRRLVVLDRHSGKVLWQRDARESFRHNAIVAGTPKWEGDAPAEPAARKDEDRGNGEPQARQEPRPPIIFCLDKITDLQLAALKRRGASLEDRPDTLLALDARTGEVLWETQENVTGTWLSYSADHDVLLQAGSKNRDRAADEVSQAMVAYRGTTGEVLWSSDESYSGPCLILDRQIITQGEAYDLLTGEQIERAHPLTDETLDWTYARNYGCNSAIGCPNLLTFRSAAAGFLDLAADGGGTGNFGGFRSSCTNNLVPAGGVLNVPDYTRTCICAYQNQTSLALVHMPNVETWTFGTLRWTGNPVRRLGVNFGAPGDRQVSGGSLWVDYPSVGGKSPDPPISIKWREDEGKDENERRKEESRSLLELSTKPMRYFRLHEAQVESHDLAFVAASGLRGEVDIEISLASDRYKDKDPREYIVRLVFCEIENAEPGQRRFDVSLQGTPVLENFDIAEAADGPLRTVIKEYPKIAVSEKLKIKLRGATDAKLPPILCGVEVVAH